jgi:hypothetical protein
MAQDILITPGSGEPQILFRGSGVNDTSVELNTISNYSKSHASGTALTFQGSEGVLFTIADNLSSGTLFSVADISGLPVIEVDASGYARIGKHGNKLSIGSTSQSPEHALDVFGSGNFRQGMIVPSQQPATTGNALYNIGGTLYFNGYAIAGYDDTYVSGVATYASGQSIANEIDISYVSGIAHYASGHAHDDVYVSGVAAYASGQAIANETDIVAVSGIANYASGLAITNETDIVATSGIANYASGQAIANEVDVVAVSGIANYASGLAITNEANVAYASGQAIANETDIVATSGIANYASGQAITNKANIATNVSNISTNAGNISTNTSNISTNTSNISTNTSNISTNTSNISTNTTNIATNTARVIYASGQAIANEDDIVAVSGIAHYASGHAHDDLYVSGVAAYASGQAVSNEIDIVAVSGIANYASGQAIANEAAIATNVSDIATNVTSITSNTNIATYASGQVDITIDGVAESSKALILDASKSFSGVKDGKFNQFDSWLHSSGVNVGNSGVILARNAPSNTSDTLYNVGGNLYFNGSQLDSSGASAEAQYASGQAIENENDIVAVSGIANYASGLSITNEANVAYASGQAIANETDIVATSGIAAYASGLAITNEADIVTASGALRTDITTNSVRVIYASGLAISNESQVAYASGQAIANETDIVAVSGIAAYASGMQLNGLGDVSYGETNLTSTLLINNVAGSSPLHGTLTGNNENNIGIGYYALGSITDADTNVALGYFANRFLTTGYNNVSIGGNAGEQMTTGYRNIQIGQMAHQYANDGAWNIAIGQEALRGNSDGTSTTENYNNVAIGHQALNKIETGDSNTAVGDHAGEAVTTGSQNVLLGRYAGDDVTTESHMLYIGHQATSSNGTFIKGDMANKYLAVGKADVTLSSDPATFQIYVNANTNKGAIVRGAATQSANLQEWQANNGIAVALVAADGSIASSGNISTSGSFIAGSHNISSIVTAGTASGVPYHAANGVLTSSSNLRYNFTADILEVNGSTPEIQLYDSENAETRISLGTTGTNAGDPSLAIKITNDGNGENIDEAEVHIFPGTTAQRTTSLDVATNGGLSSATKRMGIQTRIDAVQATGVLYTSVGDKSTGDIPMLITTKGGHSDHHGIFIDKPDNYGRVGVGNDAPSAQIHVTSRQSVQEGIIVQGAVSQSANLQEWQANNAIVVAHVAADGSIASSGNISASGEIFVADNDRAGNGGSVRFGNNAYLASSTNDEIYMGIGSQEYLSLMADRYSLRSGSKYAWSSNNAPNSAYDTALARNAAGIVSVLDSNDDLATILASGASVSGVQLLNHVPASTTNRLYNEGGTLKFNGSAVGGGSGGGDIEGVTAGNGLSGGGTSGTVTLNVEADQTVITSLFATDIKIGEDNETKIDFEDTDTINFYAGNEKQLILTDGALTPGADNILDLGSSSVEFKDAYFDGTVTADAFAGPLTGNVTGNADTVTNGVYTSNNLSVMAATTSAQLAGVISDETGTGSLVFASSPTLVTPALGTPSALVGTNISGTAASLTVGKVTVSDSTANTNFPVAFHDESNALLDDTGAFIYNPSTGLLTATAFAGDITGDVTGNADTATLATSFTVTANDSTDETVYPVFVDGATGTQGAETDTGLTYNPSTGLLTATAFAGALTGNVTGNASGTAATVTGAAQTAITSVGTLTALQVDNINIDGNAITSTAGTDLTITPLAGQQIVLDGAIVIDAGVVTGATSITSTAFFGALTGNADTVTNGVYTTSKISVLAATTSSELAGVISDETGSGSLVFATSPTLVTPALGTPSALVGTNISGTADNLTAGTAAVATTVTITDNENENENNAIIFTAGGDLDGGNLGLESDGDLHYNPSTGTVTATVFAGALTGNVTGNVSGSSGSCTGNAATVTNGVYTTNNLSVMAATTSAQLAGVISDETGSGALVFANSPTLVTPALGTPSALVGTNITGTGANFTAGTATVATTVTITDNESENEDNAIVFTAGGDVDGGNLGLESDGTLTYNPSTGKITATGFIGALTGNADTVTNGVYTTSKISVLAATSSSELAGVISDETGSGALVFANSPTLVTPALGTPSALVATNASGTAASLTAGTATVATSITVTANNTANETVYPLFVDGATGTQGAETDTGLTYNPNTGLLTAAGFSGPLTGNVTGNASGTALTVTQAAQSAITSVGTLTSVVVADGGNIGSASDTDAISIGADGGVTLTKALIGPVGSGALSGSDTDLTIDWATGNYHEVTLNTANIDAVIFHNVTVGQRVIIRIQNDNVAPRAITWTVTSGTGTSPSSATVSWAGGTPPTITAAVDKADTFGFICRSATTFDGFVIGQNI